MIALPPKVFFDTQIILAAEREDISWQDWETVTGYLRQASRYCISSLTICELQIALANGADQYFEQHQRRFRLLVPIGTRPEVFDFIPYFVARELGLTIQRPDHLEDDFLGVIDLILAAPSKAALLNGFPVPGKPQQTVKIRLDRLTQEIQQLKQSYNAAISRRRELNIDGISLEVWTTNLLAFYGVNGVPDSAKAVIAEALSATYEFEMAVIRLARNKNFNIRKNMSDHTDGQQLCYLCDPETVFITNDSDFKNRTAKSPQASRIKTFAELLVYAENASPLLI